MSNLGEVEKAKPSPEEELNRPPPTAPPAAADLENQTAEGGEGQGVSGIIRRWKREDLLKRGSLACRGSCLLFSLVSLLIMASNKHGDWKNFDNYEEFRYLLAIAMLSTFYAGCQVLRHVHELSTGKVLLSRRNAAFLDFFGDQIVAYLLMSSLSAAIPMTNRMREGNDNIFTDSCAAAISMSFFAFLSLALSALIAGFKLSNQSYI